MFKYGVKGMGARTSNNFEQIFAAFSETSQGKYVYLCDMWTGVSKWSKSAVEYFGLPGEYMEDISTIWGSHVHPEDRKRYQKDIDDIFAGRKRYHELEYRARDRDGKYVVCACCGAVIDDENGNPAFFAGTITSQGAIKNIDPTTNLYNLHEFLNAVRSLREKGRRYRVLLVGFKHFSDVNDMYGYSFGNETMKLFASIMQEALSPESRLYRMDGSRFAVLTTELAVDDLKGYYLRLQERAKNCLVIQGCCVSLAVCGGLVVVEDCQISEHAVHAAARYALNVSKNERQGELWIVENDDVAKNKKTVEMINVLRNSIMNDYEGFYLSYQPVVSPKTGEIAGVEALLRWSKEPYGEVPPAVFIPWLEKDPAFFDLGNWVLRQAMLDGKEFLKDNPKLLVSVNLSYSQLGRSEFRNILLSILLNTGFPPEHLCLELTARCHLLDTKFLKNEIAFLRSYGIKIALDDFGTGFSSLNLLRELPVDVIKIDREFIAEIEENTADQSIVKAVITCAKELGLYVCVEGIENERVRDYMMRYPAHGYQGYFYSRPVRKEELKQLELYQRKS